MSDAVSRIDGGARLAARRSGRPARRTAEDELRDLSGDIHAASSLLEVSGIPRRRRSPPVLLRGAEPGASFEARAGSSGRIPILTIDEGRFHFSALPHRALAAGATPGQIPPPNDDYAANYDEFRGRDRFWTAINVMPDLPSVARVILAAYQAGTGEAARRRHPGRPFRPRGPARATGPVELPGHDVQIDARQRGRLHHERGLLAAPRPGPPQAGPRRRGEGRVRGGSSPSPPRHRRPRGLPEPRPIDTSRSTRRTRSCRKACSPRR